MKIRWVVSNTSDKAVASIIIQAEMMPPPACATKAEYGEGSETGSRYLVSIASHGTALVTRDDHYPRMLVGKAKDWGAQYLQQQFAVTGVFFQDGTAWPTPIDDYYHTEFVDRKLVKSAARNCSGGASVAAALDLVDIEDINGIVFEHESSQTADFDADHKAIPQLHFSCTLEGRKAICHMPAEGAKTAPATGRKQGSRATEVNRSLCR